MPSLVIICVSVFFYAASLVLHVAHRKHEENVIDIKTVSRHVEINQQQTVSLSSQNVFDLIDNYYCSKFHKFVSFEFTEGFAILNSPLTPLRASPFSFFNYFTTPVFDFGTWWEYHPRPPPVSWFSFLLVC